MADRSGRPGASPGGSPDTRPGRPTVAVVGGGIAGLAAAWELTGGATPDPSAPRVVLLESAGTLGGSLRTASFDGRPVDVGPDAFLGRRPEATTLCEELGLSEALVPVGASGAAVWVRGARRPLPQGLVLGVPSRFWPAARSGILGPRGTLRLLLDVVAPRPDARGPLGDRAIGPLVGRKLGQRVVDRLADPLVGGIHAGSVADMSAAAVFPVLLAAAQRRGSFMRALRRASAAGPATAAGPAPVSAFWALRDGMGSLVGELADQLVGRGVTIRTGAEVERLERAPSGARRGGGTGGPGSGEAWTLHTGVGPIEADGLVIAAPAPVAAALLAPHDADAATLLGGVEHASVAVLTLAYPEDAIGAPLHGTGFLVPRSPGGRRAAGEPTMVTACTYLDRKWPHLRRPGTVLLRASVGRFGDRRHETMTDEQLVAHVTAELAVMVAGTGVPRAALVTRYPHAFPQYRVHHLLRVAGLESALQRLPSVAVAGAASRGVGIPACIGSGRGAARTVLGSLSPSASRPGSTR
jgi:oxygen-dependent protoporphyrinogen oxidase